MKSTLPLLTLSFLFSLTCSATTIAVTQTGSAQVGPFTYVFYLPASPESNALQGYITTQYNGNGQTSQTVSTASVLTLSNYGIPAGAALTSAYLQDYLNSSNISDVYDSSNYGNNYAAHSYSSFAAESASSNGTTETLAGSGYLNATLLADIQAGDPLTVNSEDSLVLYSNSNDWYCSSFFGCSYTENTRTATDYFSNGASLQLTYTPDSAPTITASALSVANGSRASLSGSGTSALGYGLTYSWLFSNGLTATGANPSIDFSSPAWSGGTYTATLTATDPYGYSSSATTDITVTPEPGTFGALGLALIGLGLAGKRARAFRSESKR